jgi:hypothetical protein
MVKEYEQITLEEPATPTTVDLDESLFDGDMNCLDDTIIGNFDQAPNLDKQNSHY